MEQYKFDILWKDYQIRKKIGFTGDSIPEDIREELSEKFAELQKKVASRPDKIESAHILTRVIELGLADTASKARNWLASHKIGTAKDLEAYANLEKLNKENKPLIDNEKKK